MTLTRNTLFGAVPKLQTNESIISATKSDCINQLANRNNMAIAVVDDTSHSTATSVEYDISSKVTSLGTSNNVCWVILFFSGTWPTNDTVKIWYTDGTDSAYSSTYTVDVTGTYTTVGNCISWKITKSNFANNCKFKLTRTKSTAAYFCYCAMLRYGIS